MNDRPWSAAEVEAEIPTLLDKLDDAVTRALSTAVHAAEARRDHRREESLATLKVKGRNADERKARVHLHLIEAGGKTVGQLEYEADLADANHRSVTNEIRTLSTRADLLRSLLVSARTVA